jgi:hypothetical protein
MMVLVLTVFASVALAEGKGVAKVGKLFLFQKCDVNRIDDSGSYDASGCPVLAVPGPWPIIPDNNRWGQMRYNLLGDEFKFSFEGKNLAPEKNYTLIYYPDPWPGKGLICLGRGVSDPAGNVQVHGKMEVASGLPAPYDANFTPWAPSGAVGAKIWLVSTDDVKCESSGDIDAGTGLPADPTMMLGWNPSDYLLEGNLIVYQYTAPLDGDSGDDDQEIEDGGDGDGQDSGEVDNNKPTVPAPQNNGNNGKGGGQGNGPNKDKHN